MQIGDFLQLRSCEVRHLALEFGHVSYHMEYMGSTLKAMYEAWDDLLFNLDSQLSGYSQVCWGRRVNDEERG